MLDYYENVIKPKNLNNPFLDELDYVIKIQIKNLKFDEKKGKNGMLD